MPLFNEIVVRQARPAFSARSVRDAYVITLNEHGALDFGRMAELLGPGSSQKGVRDAVAGDGLIFDDPECGWQTADAYLSGNVKRKLATAEMATVAEPGSSATSRRCNSSSPLISHPGRSRSVWGPTGFRRLMSTNS